MNNQATVNTSFIELFKRRWTLFIPVIIGIIALRVFFIIQDNPDFNMYDDEQNYTIAQNYLIGKDYSFYNKNLQIDRKSSFHTSSTVFLYKFLIKNEISKQITVVVFYILSTCAYLLAIIYVLKILILLGVNRKISEISVLVFALSPSLTYAMGAKYHFDNLIMPLLVINLYYILYYLKEKELSYLPITFLFFSIPFSCFLRTQFIPVYFLLGVFMLFQRYPVKARTNVFFCILIIGLTTLFLYIPILKKNNLMFGKYIISTQAGFEFLQGHNSFNNGNWIFPERGNALESFVHQKIPAIDTLNEYEDGLLRKQLAIDWISQNPGLELKYTVKKMLRYFVPENLSPLKIKPYFRFHPLTILFHVAFIVVLFYSLFRFREFLFSYQTVVLLFPVIATLMLSVIFYFDFKVRYHAEPFMFIYAVYGIDKYIERRLSKQNGLHS